jgi:hypothetical protein
MHFVFASFLGRSKADLIKFRAERRLPAINLWKVRDKHAGPVGVFRSVPKQIEKWNRSIKIEIWKGGNAT